MILKYKNTSADVSACRKRRLIWSVRESPFMSYRRDIYFLSFLSEEGARNSKKVNLSFYAPSYDRKELCDPLLSQKSPICLPGERFGFTCCPAYIKPKNLAKSSVRWIVNVGILTSFRPSHRSSTEP